MSDQPENMTLRLLRSIDARLDRIETDLKEIKERLGYLEAGYASASRRIDRLDERLARVEQRLGLIDPAIP